MADEALNKAGLFFDELNKTTSGFFDRDRQLHDETTTFGQSTRKFETVTTALIELMDTLAKAVEREKLKAIGSRNALRTTAKQKEQQKLQLQTLIREQQTELERLRIEHEFLQREEQEQKEMLQEFLAVV